MYSSLPHLQSYCVGVLQAAVLSLVQDVEASALVVRTVGPTGNLMYIYIYIYIYRERERERKELQLKSDAPTMMQHDFYSLTSYAAC